MAATLDGWQAYPNPREGLAAEKLAMEAGPACQTVMRSERIVGSLSGLLIDL